jgi:hypothetical protein
MALAEAAVLRLVWACRLPGVWLRQFAYALHGLRVRKSRLDVGSEIDDLARDAEFTARPVNK